MDKNRFASEPLEDIPSCFLKDLAIAQMEVACADNCNKARPLYETDAVAYHRRNRLNGQCCCRFSLKGTNTHIEANFTVRVLIERTSLPIDRQAANHCQRKEKR